MSWQHLGFWERSQKKGMYPFLAEGSRIWCFRKDGDFQIKRDTLKTPDWDLWMMHKRETGESVRKWEVIENRPSNGFSLYYFLSFFFFLAFGSIFDLTRRRFYFRLPKNATGVIFWELPRANLRNLKVNELLWKEAQLISAQHFIEDLCSSNFSCP